MKAIGRNSNSSNRNVLRQVGVQRNLQSIARKAPGQDNMGTLRKRVNTSIRSTSTFNVHAFTPDTGAGFLNFFLDGPHADLALPAVVVGAVVGDSQQIGRHNPDHTRLAAQEHPGE
jgi:hypothetical protein